MCITIHTVLTIHYPAIRTWVRVIKMNDIVKGAMQQKKPFNFCYEIITFCKLVFPQSVWASVAHVVIGSVNAVVDGRTPILDFILQHKHC